MRILREWLHRLWGAARPARRDEDIEEEIRLHLELVVEEARRRGHDPDEAMRIARLEAGGRWQAMEAMRDQRGMPWLEDLGRDVIYGLRVLKRHPGFAATAMLSLALGVGANTGIFSLVDQVLLRQLPVREPERLVRFDWNGPSLPDVVMGDGNLISYPLCRDLQEQEQFFAGAFCRQPGTVNLSAGAGYEVVRAELVSGSYFDVLGIRPEIGRLIGPSDDLQPGEHPVVVLSFDYWRNRLGASAAVVGRKVLVNRHPMTVIGVAAAGFRGTAVGQPAAAWVPAMMAREATIEFGRILDRRAFWMHGFARLRPGIEPEQAAAGLQPWFAAMLEADTRREGFPRASPEQLRDYLASSIDVVPAAQGWSSLRRLVAQPLWALLAGTMLLLVLACLNVASLLLARGAERSHELTTRMALGASRARITRQLIVEGLIVALAGGLLGLAIAPLVSRLLLLFLPPGLEVTPVVDVRLFLFALVSSVLAGVLCSIAPALQTARRPLTSSISGRSTAGAPTVRFRKLIVGAQLALTLVLLSAAGLFVQTAASLYTRDRGFDSTRLLMFRADPAGAGSTDADAPLVMRNVVQALREAPGVERVAIGNNTLLGSLGPGRVLTIGADRQTVLDTSVPMMRVSPGFFETLGTRVIAGREFEDRDAIDIERTGYRSIVVNESFARRYFGDRHPVGSLVGFGNLPDTPVDIEIVGVVSDFRRRYLRDDSQPEHIFVPFAQEGPLAGDGTFYVRVRGEPESAFGIVRAAVARVDPALPVLGLTTLEDQVASALRSELMLATLSSSFGAVALLLSVVGLFGVMSFVVTQRTQEIGMRMALGATRSAAMWLVVRDALGTIGAGAAVGAAAGLAAGLLAAPWLRTVLYGVSPSDVATLATTTTVLAVVALAACVVPAGRAALLSPMVAIRDEPESIWKGARRTVGRAVRDLASGGESRAVAPVTLISEFTSLVQSAASFPDALRVALSTLRERTGAEFVMLLEKASSDEYQGDNCAIPARGVLVNRLTHYRHPLPLTPGDFEAWLRWALEFRPEHVPEIERLRDTGARIAVALRTKHEIVGVLLLGPSHGREGFADPDKELLATAAEVFALMIENARLNDRALEQEKTRRDLALAAEVQRRLLPPGPPSSVATAFAAFTMPARSIGGDFYDFVELSSDRIGIAVADISGKGIFAALLTSVVQASLRVISAEGDIRPSQLAAKMNGFLYRSTAANNYATFFYAQLDADGSRMQYVNAGHNPPYVVRRTEHGVEIAELRAGGTVLGLFHDADYEDGEIELRTGDLFLAFTDGVTEARTAGGEEFGEERLKDLLRGAAGASAADVSSLLADRMREWIAGAEQYDDLTFVVARMN